MNTLGFWVMGICDGKSRDRDALFIQNSAHKVPSGEAVGWVNEDPPREAREPIAEEPFAQAKFIIEPLS